MGRGKSDYLAITGYSAEFARQEMVRGPGTADCNLAVLELLSSGVIAVLVLFHALAVDQVGDVDQHAFRSNLLAADFFFQRVKKLVDLHGQGACLGLAFTLAGGLYPEFREVVASDRIREFHIDHGFAEGTVADDQLDVHFRLAPKPGNALAEGAPVDPDGLTKGVVVLENGAELEGQDCGVAEAIADHSGVLDRGFLVKLAGCVVVFADDNGEFTTGVAENCSSIDALNTF